MIERDFQADVAHALQSAGWSVARRVLMLAGRLDILAVRGNLRWLIECKCTADFNSLAHAIGQLLMYAVGDTPGEAEDIERRLIVCLPTLLPEEYCGYAHALGIELLTLEFLTGKLGALGRQGIKKKRAPRGRSGCPGGRCQRTDGRPRQARDGSNDDAHSRCTKLDGFRALTRQHGDSSDEESHAQRTSGPYGLLKWSQSILDHSESTRRLAGLTSPAPPRKTFCGSSPFNFTWTS